MFMSLPVWGYSRIRMDGEIVENEEVEVGNIPKSSKFGRENSLSPDRERGLR